MKLAVILATLAAVAQAKLNRPRSEYEAKFVGKSKYTSYST